MNQKYKVNDNTTPRLDRFIRRQCFDLTQGIIEQYLRNGKILVNDKKAKSNTRLNNGDMVTISDITSNSFSKITNDLDYSSPSVISLAKKILGKYLIFQCKEFIAINKPQALATQGGSKIDISIDHALKYLNKKNDSKYKLVHRLDKNTSGVLIIAKNLESSIKLAEAFKNKSLQKHYIAAVSSKPPKQKGEIENYLDKDKSGTYDIVTQTQNGKFAKTLYEIIGSNKNIFLIKYTPLTGRMHQLRVHSANLGCPILGDIKYGGKNYKRMMLHAWSINLPSNIFGQEYNITAPLDDIFESLLTQMSKVDLLK